MATMIAEVCDALIECGASTDKARQAATAVAKYDERFIQFELTLTQIQGQLGRMEERLSYTPTKAEFTEFTNERRREFAEFMSGSQQEFAEFTNERQREFAEFMSGMRQEFVEFKSEMRQEFSALEVRLTRWILAMAAFGGLVGSVLTIAAKLLKIIP